MTADMVYEGGRSILGPYMDYLQASMILVGVVSIGDVIGYLVRGVAGEAARRLGEERAWVLLVLGYSANIAIPLLALAGTPEIALALIIVERTGKGVRAPVKDGLIASLTENTSLRGVAYGVHEVLDQLGAVAGPLMVAYMLGRTSYASTFSFLLAPFVVSMVILVFALILYRSSPAKPGSRGVLPWNYMIGVSVPMAGFIHWALMGAVFSSTGVSAGNIAVAYSIAMLADVLLAIPFTVVQSRVGDRILIIVPVLSALATVSVLQGNVYLAGAFWGMAMSAYETIVKAGLAGRISGSERMYAFGMMGVLQGVALTLGNIVIATLYSCPVALIFYIGITETISLVLLSRVKT